MCRRQRLLKFAYLLLILVQYTNGQGVCADLSLRGCGYPRDAESFSKCWAGCRVLSYYDPPCLYCTFFHGYLESQSGDICNQFSSFGTQLCIAQCFNIPGEIVLPLNHGFCADAITEVCGRSCSTGDGVNCILMCVLESSRVCEITTVCSPRNPCGQYSDSCVLPAVPCPQYSSLQCEDSDRETCLQHCLDLNDMTHCDVTSNLLVFCEEHMCEVELLMSGFDCDDDREQCLSLCRNETLNITECGNNLSSFCEENYCEVQRSIGLDCPQATNVVCDAESFSFPGEAAVYVWRETEGGSVATTNCSSSNFNDVVVTRMCSTQGEWQEFDADECGDLDDNLEMILNEMVNGGTIVAVSEQLSMAVSMSEDNPADQGSENLGMIAQVFENVATFVNDSGAEIQPSVVEGLVETLNSLLQWEEAVLANGNSSCTVDSFEVVAALFAQQVPFDEPLEINNNHSDTNIVFVAERNMLEDLQMSGRRFTYSENEENVGTVTIGDNEDSPAVLGSQEVATISLPASLFTSRTDIGVFYAVYDVPSLFPVTQNVSNEIRSRSTVVGSRVFASTVGPRLNFRNLEEPVTILLRLVRQKEMFRARGSEVCVSWDFDLGGWTTEGCTTSQVNDEVFMCNCTHLTNFAILVDICKRLEDCGENPLDRALSFITYIGVSISLVFLVLTVVTLLVFKDICAKDNSKFHIQLCIALFCMLLVFVVGVEQTTYYEACVTVSALIHYFTLAAVMWMGAEALLMFQKLVLVFKRTMTKYIVIVSLICWFVPLIPVLLPLIVDLATGSDHNDDIIVRRDVFCFLNHVGAFWGAFLGLIFIVLIFNVVVFCVVIFVLIKYTKGKLMRENMQLSAATACHQMISLTGIMFLFGLSWLFAALTITVKEVRLVAQILFTVFNSLQGFFIFLFFCVFSKEARESWKELLSCGKYKSQFLHPNTYSPGVSNNKIMMDNEKTASTRTSSL